jgi:hypothetical protein
VGEEEEKGQAKRQTELRPAELPGNGQERREVEVLMQQQSMPQHIMKRVQITLLAAVSQKGGGQGRPGSLPGVGVGLIPLSDLGRGAAEV